MSKDSNLAEVVFKGERRAIYRNRQEIDIKEGDLVIVEAERGEDLGTISLVGNLVKLKRGKGEVRGVIRKANANDQDTARKNEVKEGEAYDTCKNKIRFYNLEMKLVDVEVQFDSSKITFYFTAAQRVDFRELVKDLAGVYRTRIELRQIGVRDEARRKSGYGICGRKQCCCAFLEEFEQITTQMAKDQQLSLNPTKISGNCGRLLCCIRYEESMYHDTLRDLPTQGSTVKIDEKTGTLSGVNVVRRQVCVHCQGGAAGEWIDIDEFKKNSVVLHHNPKPA